MASPYPQPGYPAQQGECSGSYKDPSHRQEPVIRLHGYDILMDVGMRPHAHLCKVRPKLHDDVPVYMDDEEPCYALKCIDMNEQPNLSPDGKQRAVREAQALLKLQHPNVARYHKAFLSEGRLCYMTEFADQTLHHLIYTMKERQQRLSEDLTWHLFIQICHGLKKLHDSAIIHRALKARNLLLLAENLYADPVFKYRCKLTDLGIPELQRHLRLSSLSGSTLRYLAPEVLSKQPQDEKVDVWALGCILYEMTTFSHAFSSTSAIQRGEFAPLPADLSPELAHTITLLLQPNPQQRPSVAQILSMPAVRSRLAEWPYPVALNAPPDAELGAAATRPGAASRPPPEPPANEAEARPAAGLGTLIPRGTLVWAKHGSDGLWHRGMVQTPVDHDCYLVQFTERNCVDIVWHDGLRPYGPPGEGGGGEGGGGEGGGGGVILGFGKDDMQASSPVKDGSIERKRSVRWSDSLSSHGGSDKGDGARRGAGGKTESMSGHTVIASSTNASSRDVSRAVSEVGGDPYLMGSGRAALSGLPPLGPIGGGGGALPEQQRGGRGADGVPQLAVSTARSSGGGGSKACVIL